MACRYKCPHLHKSALAKTTSYAKGDLCIPLWCADVLICTKRHQFYIDLKQIKSVISYGVQV